LEALSSRVPVCVYGGGWDRVSARSPLRHGLRPPVFESQLRAVVASAGINVAFVAKANRDQHTMRTFEIPACGGFMLAERTPFHTDLFREDEEAAFFGSTEELVAKAVDYLADAGRRRRVAEAGCRRVTGRERYEDRAARVLEIAREVLRSKGA
jgi:spore maturation protein CgeB